MYLFTDLGPLVIFAKVRAQRGIYDGVSSPRNLALMQYCSHLYAINPEVSARMIYTRDAGMHSGGWWKNPDYERCLHLSISFCVNPTDAPLPFDAKRAELIARAFFGGDCAKAWVEPPYSAEGKACEVFHYRVFCNEGSAADHPAPRGLQPRGHGSELEIIQRDSRLHAGTGAGTVVEGGIRMMTMEQFAEELRRSDLAGNAVPAGKGDARNTGRRSERPARRDHSATARRRPIAA